MKRSARSLGSVVVLLLLGACGGSGPDGAAPDAADTDTNARRAATAALEAVPAWQKIAAEGQTFTLDTPRTVRYGSGAAWIVRTLGGRASCSNAFFGIDPLYGVVKRCEVAEATAPDAGWIKIADEWQAFPSGAMRTVRYGIRDRWVSRDVAGAGECSNRFFGADPFVGIVKECRVPAPAGETGGAGGAGGAGDIGGAGPALVPVPGDTTSSGVVRHVSGTGSDANPGTQAQPWQSLARVQAAIDAGSLAAGGAVLFERGHRYAGTLTLGTTVRGSAAAPVVLAAYGQGTAPVLHGLRTLQGWQPIGAGRWHALCTACSASPALLRLDGRIERVARWPNEDEADRGYRYFTATNGRSSITDAGLPAGVDWTGGELVLRSIAWVLDRLPIAAQAGTRLDAAADASYPLETGWGYFIQNHPAAIDREGEWAWRAADRSITLQSAVDPNTRRVEVPIERDVLTIAGAAHLLVRDLVIEGAARHGVTASGCTGLRLQRGALQFVGNHGLLAEGCSDVTVEDSIVRESMNVGVRMGRCAGCSVQRTSVSEVGMHAGMGANGDGAYVGLEVGAAPGGRPARVQRVRVSHIGYIGVSLTGNVTMSQSLVSDFNQVKTDGAGIYTYRNTDIVITENTVRDAGGSTAGTPWGSTGTHGIYLDDNSERLTVSANTVSNVGASAVYLHNTRDASVLDNVLVGAGEAGILMVDDTLGSHALERSTLRGNTVVVRGVPMIQARSPLPGLFGTLGTIDANRFCDPFADPQFRVGLGGAPDAGLDLASWRAGTGRDTSSSTCPDRLAAFSVTGTPGANRVANGGFDADLSGWFGWPADTLDARRETGRLDGGSLRLGFAGPSPLLHFDAPLGAVPAGQDWLLEFSSIAVAGAPQLDVYLRQGGSPYQALGSVASVLPGGTRGAHALLVDSARAEADALLIFEMRRAGTTVGIDNVRLRPVTALRRRFADVVRVEFNASAAPRNVVVGGATVTSLDGSAWPPGSTLPLAPFRSLVLLRP